MRPDVLTIAIVDDEPLARERLRGQLDAIGGVDVVGEGGSGLAAIELAERLAPDVLLLDIRMPGMDGIEAARHLSRLAAPPAVIFTTAYDEHALAAFEAHAVDYLLKPIRNERLGQALARAQRLSGARAAGMQQATQSARTHLSALVKGDLRIVPVSEVRCLQADQGYVSVFHPGGTLLVEEALRALEEEFAPRFLRVHRNALVAVDYVVALERDRLGNVSIRMRDLEMRLPVSRRLLGPVRKRLRG